MNMLKSRQREANKKVRIRCSNPNCDYVWTYSGRLFFYATCPSCRRNVKIHDNKTELQQSVRIGPPSQIAAVRNTSAGADV
jgi:hypothetical protein